MRSDSGERVIAGNVTFSNVPGPAKAVYLAGFELLANHPAPVLGSGRFLNITLRRYCDQLDLGIMTDPDQVEEVDKLRREWLYDYFRTCVERDLAAWTALVVSLPLHEARPNRGLS